MDSLNPRVQCLLSFYLEAEHRMRGLPMHNPKLQVEVCGFRTYNLDHELDQIGVILTPWFMNLVLIPENQERWSASNVGEKVTYQLPSGDYEFIINWYEETGGFATCALFSPMHKFKDHQYAIDTADEVIRAVFDEANEYKTDLQLAKKDPRIREQEENIKLVETTVSTPVMPEKLSRRGFLTAGFTQSVSRKKGAVDGS